MKEPPTNQPMDFILAYIYKEKRYDCSHSETVQRNRQMFQMKKGSKVVKNLEM